MANKYSKFEFQPYVSMYVDPQTVNIQKIMRQRWDANKAQSDLIRRSVKNWEVGPGDQVMKEEAIQNIESQFEDAITRGNWEEQGSLVSDVANDFLTNRGLQLAKKTYENRQAELKAQSEIRMKNGNVLFDYEYVKDPNSPDGFARDGNGQLIKQNKFENHRSYYQDEQTGEMVENVYQPVSEQQGDWNGTQSSFITTIATDTTGLAAAYRIDSGALSGYLQSATGVSQAKVNNLASGLAQAYIASTPEGQQQMRYLTEQAIGPNGVPYTQQEALQEITGQFISKMNSQVGFKVNLHKDHALLEATKNAGLSNKTLGTLDLNTTSQIYKQNSGQLDYTDNKLSPLHFMVDENGYISSSNRFDDIEVIGGATPKSGPVTKPGPKHNKPMFDANGNYNFYNADAEVFINAGGGEQNRDNAIKTLDDKFQLQLKQNQGLGETNEEIIRNKNRKYIQTHIDQYVAYLLTEHADSRKNFNNDRDFLQSIYDTDLEMSAARNKYYGAEAPFNLNKADVMAKGNFDSHTMLFRNPHTGVVHEGSMDGDLTNENHPIYAMGHYYKNTWMGSQKKRGVKGKDSGLNGKDTINAIEIARKNADNISVYGISPSGVGGTQGTYMVRLKVPAKTVGKNKEFYVNYQVQMEKQLSDVFTRSHQVLNNLREKNYTAVEEFDLGYVQGENGEVLYQHAVVDYHNDGSKSGKRYTGYQPRMRVYLYRESDMDQYGNPIQGAVPVPHGQQAGDPNYLQFYGYNTVLGLISQSEQAAYNALEPVLQSKSYTESSGKTTY